jgi:UDP-N-acetylmuramate-alanine ligase
MDTIIGEVAAIFNPSDNRPAIPHTISMHIHILGICGTFMGGIAVIAQQAGHTVTGCDANVYPPMSTQLESLGIRLIEGFGVEQARPESGYLCDRQRGEPGQAAPHGGNPESRPALRFRAPVAGRECAPGD